VISIVSLSTRPRVPTPLDAKYRAAGHPKPPQPIIKALFFLSLMKIQNKIKRGVKTLEHFVSEKFYSHG